MQVLKGKGSYLSKSQAGEITHVGKALRYLGGLGGSALAPMIGGTPAGGSAGGRALGALVSRWLGYGAYEVKRNTIMDSVSGSIPMMHQTGQSIVVRHREYVCDVIGSGAAGPTPYYLLPPIYLNPGLSQSFPWLASVARQFQEYTWRGLVFHFISTSGESVASTNTSLGSVMLHTDYRVTANSPLNKAELLNEYFATDAKPSESFIHPIECDPKENPYNVQYVRTGAVPFGEDAKSYDLGKVNVATMGLPSANLNIGELWVTYEVELRKPQVASFSGDEAFYKGASPSAAAPLGTSRVQVVDSIGLNVTNTSVSFPTGLIGTFLVLLAFSDSGLQTLEGVTPSYTNCAPIGAWDPVYDHVARGQPVALSTNGFLAVKVNLTLPNATASVSFNVTAMTNCQMTDICVARVAQVTA